MLNKIIEILISMLLLIPVFSVLNKTRFHSIKRTMLYYIFATYLAAVYLFVGMPTLQLMRFDLSLTLTPYLPMIADLKNTILNIILFIPLGIMLPFLWKKYITLKATLLFGFSMSLAIELLQILTYRATDINDLIANTVGAVLGYLIFRTTSCIFPPVTKFARRKNEIRVHDIRHNYAGMLVELVFSPLLIAERLGHERVRTTMETYSHLYPNKQAEVAMQLDGLAVKD